MSNVITAAMVNELRQKTGAGMMECKKALVEVGNDMEKAITFLRERGLALAAKKTGRAANEGRIHSYIHSNGKIGVMLEINCETDFVARTEAFQALAKDICLHVAAANPQYLDRASVPAAMIDKEKEIYSEQLKTQGKPANVVEGILKGKLDKFYEDMCLLEQAYVKDDSKKVEQIITEASAETGEKITIRRFVRYELGEGIQKEEKNFAEEVAAQLKK